MRARLFKIAEDLRASYWFIPLVLAILAAVLAFVLVSVDMHLDAKTFGDSPFFFASQPSGARAVISATGGSMLGVAGTVFSVTMAAVVYASGSYGPRLLSNFMNDRGNQFVLGTFTATYVYSILVLRTVREATTAGDGTVTPAFVPNIAMLGSTVLTLCSIGVLIFFIHHVPSNIYIVRVIAGIGRSLLAGIDARFPRTIGDAPEGEAERRRARAQIPPPFRDEAAADAGSAEAAEIASDEAGYIQIFDDEILVGFAREKDIVIRVNCRPGSFVQPGSVLFDVWPRSRVDDAVRDTLREAVAISSRRSPKQDLLFLVDELVEIGSRALSPGVNDPYTAVTCLEWMGVVIGELAGRNLPSPLRLDPAGDLRVIGLPVTFEGFVERGFGRLRQYAAGDAITASAFLAALAKGLRGCRSGEERAVLARAAERLMDLAEETLSGPTLADVRKAKAAFDAVLAHPSHREPSPLLIGVGVGVGAPAPLGLRDV
ncbi:DUF2254 domain-containing protein [Aureimonas pseudogalii]|uniref:Putative membrane protein n=1 Tax=Aureimonas pseudogalii TaxID=1744844 RepID=A0A7W6ECU3_9HYPH|nr:DUF2254 domain-containing protein [Aureimonas pseudogalii]MBB3996942.1 putative membrane protein [Aureimonas pseudogalii]